MASPRFWSLLIALLGVLLLDKWVVELTNPLSPSTPGRETEGRNEPQLPIGGSTGAAGFARGMVPLVATNTPTSNGIILSYCRFDGVAAPSSDIAAFARGKVSFEEGAERLYKAPSQQQTPVQRNDPVIQHSFGLFAMPTPLVNWDGIGYTGDITTFAVFTIRA